MTEHVSIVWDRPKLERLKLALAKSTGDEHAAFTFEGNEFIKGYASYLIEYLENKLSKPK